MTRRRENPVMSLVWLAGIAATCLAWWKVDEPFVMMLVLLVLCHMLEWTVWTRRVEKKLDRLLRRPVCFKYMPQNETETHDEDD